MVDSSLHHNLNQPHKATHLIFSHEKNPSEITLFSNINSHNNDNRGTLPHLHPTSFFNQNQIFQENVGKRQVVNFNNPPNGGIEHSRPGVGANAGEILLLSPTQFNRNRERPKTSFKTSLPFQNSIQKEDIHKDIPGKQVTVQHSINIVAPTSLKKNNIEIESDNHYHDLPSAAESPQSDRGNGNNNLNNRNKFGLDYVDVEYVTRGSQIDLLISPTSNLNTHMHQIHPTFIPRHHITTSTEKVISNPLLDPKFNPIGSSSGKRWSIKNEYDKGTNQKVNNRNNNLLKASNFPDLPSLDVKRNCGCYSTYLRSLANVLLNVILTAILFIYEIHLFS